MVTRNSSPTLFSALGILFACSIQQVTAFPFPKDDLRAAGFGYLLPRQCDNPCGMDNQYCCAAGSTCFTSNGIAGCSAAAGGGYAIYTTTWTQTATYTSTISTYFPAATGSGGADCVPPPGSGQKACGSICCASWQYCAYAGQCMGNGGGALNPSVSSGGPQTTQFSAPYRVTSGIPTGTNTGIAGGATTTGAGGVSPGGAEEGGGLSPGAIAGIVIGTIAGIILLLLICACCIVRGLWHGAMAVLGLGKKKEKETIIEEERYHSGGSRHSRRDSHGGWYGGGGRPSTVASRKEKKSSGKGLLGLGAALGTLWLLLGLRKDKKKKSAKTRSDMSGSYWSSSSYTADSPSSLSSDRRTRRSHRSGRTASRTSRVTRTTRVSRVPSPRSPRSPPR